MKKYIIMSWLLLMGLCSMGATDEFVVSSNIAIPQGGTATLNVELKNEDTPCVGFQFVLVLPEGISVANKTTTMLDFSEGERMNDLGFTTRIRQSEGVYNVLSYNDNVIPMTGTSGIVISIVLQTDAEIAVGSTLNAYLRSCKITNPESESLLLHDELPFTITIDEPDDGRIHFDETATTLPEYTDGAKGDITMKRTIKAGQWNTIVLPFNLTRANATAVFGTGVEMAKFDGFEVDYGDDEENVTALGILIKFTGYTIPARGNLAGGTPILIKTQQDITEFQLDQVTLTESVTDEEKDFLVDGEFPLHGKFTSTFVKTKVPADGLFISGNQFWYSTGATVIKAFRGWFELDAVLDKETDFSVKMYIDIDGEETRVEGMDNGQRTMDNVYDLSGRKIEKPQQRGVYIVNGKKVLVK